MLTRWYRTGVIYSADVGLFQDGNDDGTGDFQGMIGRLDYLARLGISTIWLHPIHPSPRRDGGYDITDHYGVHPRFGSLGDFTSLLHEAGERGIRVMLDLVVNHTSDQHPWFQAARSDPDSPFRDVFCYERELDRRFLIALNFSSHRVPLALSDDAPGPAFLELSTHPGREHGAVDLQDLVLEPDEGLILRLSEGRGDRS